jgi:hypothetical protein
MEQTGTERMQAEINKTGKIRPYIPGNGYPVDGFYVNDARDEQGGPLEFGIPPEVFRSKNLKV